MTAGAGNDSLVDTPTPYGTDTGAGGEVRGNYCTLNALAKGSDATLANGNLDFSYGSSATISPTISTFGMSSGKWYWEVTITASSSTPSNAILGITNVSSSSSAGVFVGNNANGWGYYGFDGTKYTNNSSSAYGASYTTNDVIGFAFDADAGSITCYKNNTSQGVMYSSLAAGTYYPAVSDGSGAQTFSAVANFGQRPFAYTAPSGYKALCTQNLPTPTIGATSTTQANDYFNTVLWTGTNSSGARSVTGVGFQPDFVWVKNRTNVIQHHLYDVLRGTGKRLSSNDTAAETTNPGSGYLSSFDSDGFSSVAGTTDNQNFNQLNSSFVAWNWKANGTGVTNTSGTITSTVSANTTSGFSIVTYTGNGTGGATVGHGLGAVPSMIIVKSRDQGTTGYTGNWYVYHASNTAAPATDYLLLNTTAATADLNTVWNDTAPTSSVFSIGTLGGVNDSGDAFVAYCFAEIAGYSAFGSYTGNGSTDGPFVFCGFRPRYVLIKGITNAGASWNIRDTARNTYNAASNALWADLADAENASGTEIDILSNGFKVRGTGLAASSTTYIFAAFAESPFKYSLAR